MTWILGTLGSEYNRFSPEPDMADWKDHLERRYEDFSEQKKAEHRNSKHGYLGDVGGKFEKGGGDLEPDEWPKEMRLRRKYKKLPDFFHIWYGIFMVSDGMRSLLEEFDPGVHIFKDIPFQYDTDEKFFAFHTPTSLKAINIEASDPDRVIWYETPQKYRCNYGAIGSAGVAFDASQINGRGFWRDYTLFLPCYCISDDFKAAMKKRGMSFPKNFKTKITL